MKIIISLVLLTIASYSYCQIKYLEFSSLNGKFEIIHTTKELSECRAENIYQLTSKEADTIDLLRCIVRDLRPPVFFYCEKYDILIYEARTNEQDFKIRIFSLNARDILLETEGYIITSEKNKENYIDRENLFLIYFNDTYYDNPKLVDINKLNLEDFTKTRLITVETSGNALSKWPYISELETNKRKFTLNFEKITDTNSFYQKTIEIEY